GRPQRRFDGAEVFQQLLEQRDGLGGVALLHHHLGQADPRRRDGACLLEQPLGFVEFPLPQSQLTKSRKRRRGERRTLPALELARGRGQFVLGGGPLAAPDQHARVLCATRRRERARSPAPRELLHPRAPLRGAIVVAHAFTREELPAAHHTDSVQLSHLARGGGNRRFVEPAHTAGYVTDVDARQSLERERGELDTWIAQLTAEVRGGGRVADCVVGIVPAKKRDFAFTNEQPAILHAALVLGEQRSGALEPARCDREVAAKRERIPDEPDRDARGAECIAGGAIE